MSSRTMKILALTKDVPLRENLSHINLFLPNHETTKGSNNEDQNRALEAFNNPSSSKSEDCTSQSEYCPSEISDSPISTYEKKNDPKPRNKTRNNRGKDNKQGTSNNKKIVILQDIKLKNGSKVVPKANYLSETRLKKHSKTEPNANKDFMLKKFLGNTETIEEEISLKKEPAANVLPPSMVTPEAVKHLKTKKGASPDSINTSVESCSNNFRKTNPKNQIELVAASNKNGKRIRNKTHVCYFCNKKVILISRHFEMVHFKEVEVAKYLTYPKKSRERKEGFEEIIKVGDFYHNCNVLSSKTGELVLVRRPTENELKFVKDSDYGPCPNCLGFMLKKHIWHHMKYRCTKNKADKEEVIRAKDVIAESSALISDIFGLGFTKEYYNSIVEVLRSDEIGDICKNDVLILKFGAMQFEKYADTQSEFIRQTMRQLARLTLALNNLNKTLSRSLSDFLTPEKFDLVVKATKDISMNPVSSDSVTRPEFHTPSLALKIGYALKKCIAIERGSALRAGNIKRNKSLLAFKELLDMEWNIRISSNALSTLYRRKFNATQLLPITDDLVKLSRHIDSSISNIRLSIEPDQFDNQQWTRLATLCLARIILFNKRRSGEASKMKMSDYISRPSWEEQNTEEIRQSLTTVEKKLAETMTIVEIEGKRGRRVPVLLPPIIKECIDILIRHRDQCNISYHNKYVFAKSNESKRFLRGHDCLRKICQELQLENPDVITGTKLRKYVATVCQLFDMSENEYDWLARHLGHDITVHREFYRMHESAIELTKISRILMAVDQGEAHNYAGKQINQIKIEDLPTLEEDENIEDGEEKIEDDQQSEEDDTNKIPHPDNRNENTAKANKNTRNTKEDMKKERKPQAWSNEEMQAITLFFRNNIKTNIVPSKKECDECIEKHPILSNRPWRNIKYCVKTKYRRTVD